jgi:hypothetical protein
MSSGSVESLSCFDWRVNSSGSELGRVCLERAKYYFLYEAPVKAADTIGGPELNVAAQYATIADAFRPSGPSLGHEDEPEPDRRG